MKENILIEKSIDFGARIVKLHRYLLKTEHESVLSKQILRSGTSIGANINEAQYGNSKADFIAKLHIALKETAETEYWLYTLKKSDYPDENMASSLLKDFPEIKKILIASINTAKEKMIAGVRVRQRYTQIIFCTLLTAANIHKKLRSVLCRTLFFVQEIIIYRVIMHTRHCSYSIFRIRDFSGHKQRNREKG